MEVRVVIGGRYLCRRINGKSLRKSNSRIRGDNDGSRDVNEYGSFINVIDK